MPLNRAYSLLTVKSVDPTGRTFSGVATTPEPDRVGDVVEPLGVRFKNPLSLLLFHDHQKPVGEVRFHKPTADGIKFTAQLADPESATSETLKDRIKEAADLVRMGLIRAVSIGFRPLDKGIDYIRDKDGGITGLRFTDTEVLELSLVSVPANQQAVIQTIKSIDAPHLAAFGESAASAVRSGVSGLPVVALKDARNAMKKTIADQIAAYRSTRDAKALRMSELMEKSGEEGATLEESDGQEYDGLKAEVKSLDVHIARLEETDELMRKGVKPVLGANPEEAKQARGGEAMPVIQVKDTLPKGQEYVRMVICKAAAFVEAQKGNFISAEAIAKQRYPDNHRIHAVLKAAVPPATTTDAVWAGPLVYAQNLESEFVEFLRPQTIVGRIPGLRRVPFNIRYTGGTNGGNGYWVGQGKPKPLTTFAFEANTLGYTKLAAISVLTEETVRFSSPSAEMLVRESLTAAIIERMDIDFVDPDKSAVANVSPASITNGLNPLSSAGPTADNIRTDIMNIVATFRESNLRGRIVLVMSESLALGASMLATSLGVNEFPNLTADGGNIRGIDVITSQYLSQFTGRGNIIVALNPGEIFLADDGQVSVDVSREASLEMSDAPTQNGAAGAGSSMVSLWQNNMIALRAERFVNWDKRRDNAVVLMDDVNWGSVGSPAVP